jgi:hypothetical protein
MHGGVLCQPAAHEFSRGGDLLGVVVRDADVDVDNCSARGVLQVEAVGKVRVRVLQGVSLSLSYAVADGSIDGQADQ